MPRVTIDGRTVEVAEGRTVLEAAREAGITIPTLCYHRDLSPVGSCRLCLLEAEGLRAPVPARTHRAGEGVVVRTHPPPLAGHRRSGLEAPLRPSADAGGTSGDADA